MIYFLSFGFFFKNSAECLWKPMVIMTQGQLTEPIRVARQIVCDTLKKNDRKSARKPKKTSMNCERKQTIKSKKAKRTGKLVL